MSIGKVTLDILRQPTAPLRESWVRAFCSQTCQKAGVPTFEDKAGNLWVNASSAEDIRSAQVVFVAHMDHPGIAIDSFSKGFLRRHLAHGKWLGGHASDQIVGLPVQVFSSVAAGILLEGKIIECTPEHEVTIAILDQKWAQAATSAPQLGPWGARLAFAEPQVSGDVLTASAADDLISVGCLLEVFSSGQVQKGIVALFTRDEEDGMRGALAAAAAKILSPSAKVISVEVTDYQFAETRLGEGPVIRYADSQTEFTQSVVESLTRSMEQFKAISPNFSYQVQGASKGTTEGTAFSRAGFHVGGISISLKNYHNRTEDFKVAPEQVSAYDVQATTAFLAYFTKSK